MKSILTLMLLTGFVAYTFADESADNTFNYQQAQTKSTNPTKLKKRQTSRPTAGQSVAEPDQNYDPRVGDM